MHKNVNDDHKSERVIGGHPYIMSPREGGGAVGDFW